jgi:phosphoribosylanthranilate isomerase
MSAVKIKICGLSRPADIEAVNAAKPDYIGFVFTESKREVTPEQALSLRKLLSPGIIPVGVFVDEPVINIFSLVRGGVIDVIQLHGSESIENEEYIRKLKLLTDTPVIKAVSVQSRGDVQKRSGTAADYLLLDNKGGGTGEPFDWDLIGKTDKPYFLAGGLSAENIAGAIAKTMPYAVDASSGVETNGVKDPEKIKEFIRRVRNGG